jgi:multiple sugar transport system substrate-binding protein
MSILIRGCYSSGINVFNVFDYSMIYTDKIYLDCKRMKSGMSIKRRSFYYLFLALLLLGCGLSGCDRGAKDQEKHAASISLSIWAHAGQEAERKVLQAQIARFNQQTKTTQVKLTFIPERDYNAQVQSAAIAGDLPDVLEFDGPYLYNYIWERHLLPIENLLPQSLTKDILPSIIDQGTHSGHLYSVGVFDSGLGIYGRKDILQKAGARIPRSFTDAWTVDEFEGILAKLAQNDPDGGVLDIKLNYGGEWFTYGFSPILQSAGADLIERTTYLQSSGVLNSPEAVAAMSHLQEWFRKGYIDPNIDDVAFTKGRVALSWAGHWEYDRYAGAYGDNLVLLPLPDFGKGSKTGQGSWNWGITTNCVHPEKAALFIAFLMRTEEILAMSNANSAVPGTKSAVAQSLLYGEKGPLRLFAEQLLGGAAVPRPKTPAYPVITNEFQKAFQNIRNNAEVQEALTEAAFRIDQDIRDNDGYPFTAGRE